VAGSKHDDGKWITAGELLGQLERDPQYRAGIAEVNRRRRVIVDKNMKDARPLLAELAAQGFEVQTPADLFNKRLNYKAAVPTLIEWLPRISNPDVKADLARALSVKWAKPGGYPGSPAGVRTRRGRSASLGDRKCARSCCGRFRLQ
jgi:hypothetical protein